MNQRGEAPGGVPPIANVSDEQLLAMKPLRPRKKATFDAANPSNYCHICSRTPNRGIRLAVCSGLREGFCRKVVCERCFTEYSLGCAFEEASKSTIDWKCVHCQGTCPERAQCRTYQSVNRKLRLQRLRQSAEADKSEKARQQPQNLHMKQQIADVGSYPAIKGPTGPTHASSHEMQQDQKNATKELSPSSVAARGSFILDSTAIRRSEAEQRYSRHTAVSSARVQGYSSAVPTRVYRVYSSRTNHTSFPGASNAPGRNTDKSCHMCKMSDANKEVSSLSNCSGAQNPECRNTFCDVCLKCRDLQRSREMAEARGERWNCCHCTGTCPPTSACRSGKQAVKDPEQCRPATETQSSKRGANMSLKSRILAAADVEQ